MPDISSTPPLRYAGFWRRFNAYGVDTTIIMLLAWLFDGFAGPSAQALDELNQLMQQLIAAHVDRVDPSTIVSIQQALIKAIFSLFPDYNLTLLISAVYNIVFVCGAWHATPGKHWLGMKVLRRDGTPLSWIQSALRHLFSGLSLLPMALGYLTMAFSKEKAALHDLICGTRVVRL